MKHVVNSVVVLFMLCGCTHVNKEEKNVTHSDAPQTDSTIIENNLSTIANYRYSPDNNLPITTLSEETATLLVESVNNEKKDLGQYKGLKKTATYKDNLAIYSFSYSSGGTRGNITCPIIQWKYHGGMKAGNVSAFLNCSFEKVIVLDKLKNLYLLLGHEKSDGSCNESIAYVMSIDKNELNLQYKAFEGQSYINICNGEFTYDEVKKTLNFKLNEETNTENLSDKFHPASNIYKTISSEYNTNRKFSLTFNGKIFQ